MIMLHLLVFGGNPLSGSLAPNSTV